MKKNKTCEAYTPDPEIVAMAEAMIPPMNIEHLQGWYCCQCNTYSGPHRSECKSWECDHKRCDLN